MPSTQILRKWHLYQTLAQILILIICLICYALNWLPQNRYSLIYQLTALVLCLLELTLVQPEHTPPTKWQRINHYVESLIIPFTLIVSLSSLTRMLNHYHLINPTLWMWFIFLYALVMYIPMAKLALGKIQNNWGRIVILTWGIFALCLNTPFIPGENLTYFAFLKACNESGVSGSLILIVITLIAMRDWGFKAPHFKISTKASVITVSLIILLLLLNLFSNAFPSFWFFPTWSTIQDDLQVYSFNWHFLFNLKMGLTALEAGLAEEWLMRYCMTDLLAKCFQNSRHRILWIVLCDGIWFGIWHITNATTKPLPATLQQMFTIGGWAFLIVAIYLYTDSLAIGMIYHGLFDFIGFLYNGSIIGNTATPSMMAWFISIIQVLIYAGLAYLFISGKRKKVVEYNLAQRGLS